MSQLWDPDLYARAWHFATIAHHGQTYGGRHQDQQVDYINHIGSVAMEILWSSSQSPDCDVDLAVACALLHDTVEDTKTSYEDLVVEFGVGIAKGVLALTKDKNLGSKKQQMIDSLNRIRKQPKEIWMVKMADRVTNLYHPPFYWSKDKIIAYRDEARVIYNELHSANGALASRLLQKIEDYRRFAQ